MNILVGTIEIGRCAYDMTEGFRALGHNALSVVTGPSPYSPELKYGAFIPRDKCGVPTGAIIERVDLFVFQFGCSLMPHNQDYPLIKDTGKKLICVFNGSDVRHHSAAEPMSAHYGFTLPRMCWDKPFGDLNSRLWTLRMGERWADAIFSLPYQSEMARRPYHHILIPLDLDIYHEHIPGREVPVVVHAPSRRVFKGTDQVVAAVEALQADGVEMDFRLLEGVSNADVRATLAEADIVIDELNAPHPGMLTLEALASGCLVLSGKDRRYVPGQGFSPVVAVTAETLYERLREAVVDIDWRVDVASKGRSYARRHERSVVCQRMIDAVEGKIEPEYYPTYAYDGWTPTEPIHIDVSALEASVIEEYGVPETWPRPENVVEEPWGYSTLSDRSIAGYDYMVHW